MISHFHRKTVIHEIIAKLLTLSIKLWTNLPSAFWVLITSTLHLKMLRLMKRYLYLLKKLVLDRDQKRYAAPCRWCCSNVSAVTFLVVVCFLTDVPKLIGFENKKSQINCFFHDQNLLHWWNLKVFNKVFWCAFTKTLSNLGEYFSDSFSGGDKITPSKTC